MHFAKRSLTAVSLKPVQKNSTNVSQAFQKIAKAAIKQSASNNDGVDMGEVFGDNAGTIKLKSPSKSSGDDGCGC